MVWLEKDHTNKGQFKIVEPGTTRSFSSIFHNAGQPQVEVHFPDNQTAWVFVPDITIGIQTEQPLERIIERENFTLRYKKSDSQEHIFYEAIYKEE